MIGVILAVPVFLLVLMLQTTVMSTLPLLNGTADLVLLVLLAWAVQERVRSAVEWAAIGGALVGIISHVSELKDRIPVSLQIEKDEEKGSLIYKN